MATGINKMKRSAEDAGLQDCCEGCSKRPIYISEQEETTAPPKSPILEPSLGPYLGQLPAELRVQIYESAYSDAVIDVKDSPRYHKKGATRRSEIKKLGVCRLLYVETRKVMLQNATFASTNQFAILEFHGTHEAEFLRNSIRTISMRDEGLWAAKDISQLFPNLRKLILRVTISHLALPGGRACCIALMDMAMSQLEESEALQRIPKIPTLRDVELRVDNCVLCAHFLEPDVRLRKNSPRFGRPSDCRLHMMTKEAEVLVLGWLWRSSTEGRQRKVLLKNLRHKGDEYVALRWERQRKVWGGRVDAKEVRWFKEKLARVKEKCHPVV